MSQSENLTYEDFSKVLTPQHLKELQIIYIALGFGVLIFTIILFFIYSNIADVVTFKEDSQILRLSVIHFILLFSCFPVSNYLFNNIIQRTWLFNFVAQNLGKPENTTPVEPAKAFWDRLKNAHIIRLALFEGIALFGLVICTLAIFDGVLQVYPVYWVNLTSSFVFGFVLVSNFPNIEKMETFFREYIQGRSLRHFKNER